MLRAMRAIALGLLVCLASVAFADDDIEMDPDPAAQPQGKDPKQAKKWLETARQLTQKGDAASRAKKLDEAKVSYENAITAYEKAIETGGDANVNFDLAGVEEKAGKLDRAAMHYRVLVKAQGARADLVKKATARYDDITTKTGLVTLITKPETATISIGETEIAKTPLVDPIVLLPGHYALTLSAEGHAPKDVELDIEAGSETERTIELEVAKVKTKPVKVVEKEDVRLEAPEAVPAGPNKLPLYVGVGATGGFVLIATITGIMAVGKHSTFEDKNASPNARQDAKDSGKTLAVVTDVCLVGAVAAGAFTAYWYFRKYKPAKGKIETKTAIAPWVQPAAGGISLAGSF
jgi:hypothetical protein